MLDMKEADFKEKLEQILINHIPDCKSLESVVRLSGGASQETYRIEIRCPDDKRILAMRRAPEGAYNEARTDRPGLAGEAQLMRSARAAGVPAPAVYYVLTRADELGDGFIMEWIDGEGLGARIVRRPEYEHLRPILAYEIGKILARIHDIDIQASGLQDYLTHIPPAEFITQTWDRYIAMETPQPMIDYTGRWLRENLADLANTEDLVLVHNDFRNGNFMVTPERVVAVLDWEAAHIGDPMRDLGWICTNSWRYGGDAPVGGFGSYEDLFRGYEEVAGKRVDPDQVKYWQVFGSFWWAVVCLGMVTQYRGGPDRSIERASIGRRTSEALIDCVNLIIPGPVDLISENQVRENLDMPRADELIAAVSDFLRNQVMTETEGRTSFLSRVSANSLDIVGRELDLSGEHRRRELAGLQAFYHHEAHDSSADLASLRWRLVHALRDGSQSLADESLKSYLRNVVANQVAIDQPRYSGLHQALAR
ncbi:MAG: phosphotransferase [Gammaproteobacteria bacterium]|nr:phosphotransferase [Gammaproteobacteria bacterium]